MKEPTFDKDGYPAEETLETVRLWEYSTGIKEWLRFIEEAWYYPDYIRWESNEMHISTGGWSGNESLIEAMKGNGLWHITWVQSRRGGHYIFEFPIKGENNDIITN